MITKKASERIGMKESKECEHAKELGLEHLRCSIDRAFCPYCLNRKIRPYNIVTSNGKVVKIWRTGAD